LIVRIAHFSRRVLTRVAAALALVGLAMMAFAIVVPRPVPVILAMSLGHAIGFAAVLCYLLAVILDVWHGDTPVDSLAPPRVRPKDAKQTSVTP
jgi:hypothetical protein